jgi:pyruvate formate lyase activating enzyme
MSRERPAIKAAERRNSSALSFRPGSSILSIGFFGCNLRCPFCQNWHISQVSGRESKAPGRSGGQFLSPAEVIAQARSGSFRQIAYTYSEPLVHAEFLLDCMRLAHAAGIANVLVSNGCVNSEAAADILALTDAANIDLKAFSEESYSRVLGGDLNAVLAFIRAAHEAGVHLEITTLVVPGLNDGPEELRRSADFIAGLSRDIPWHLSAYHPDYRWDAPPTDPSLLVQAALRARESLSFVYVGNVAAEQTTTLQATTLQDTACPGCGSPLVQRRGYRINTDGLALRELEGRSAYFCAKCGQAAPIAW